MSSSAPSQNASATDATANRRSRKKLTEAERIKEMERAALNAAILKPFIESLFDDNRDGGASHAGGGGGGGGKDKDGEVRGGGGWMTKSALVELPLQPAAGATIGMSGMPSMRYQEALARETAKPFRLNTLVSIDAAPLPTRTAAPVYMELVQPRMGEAPQHAACLDHRYKQQLRDSFTQALRSADTTSPHKIAAHQRGSAYLGGVGGGGGNKDDVGDDDDETNSHLNSEEARFEKELMKNAAALTGLGGGGGQVRPPDIYGPVKQAQMLEDAHLEMLMRTVNQVKERQMYDNMWGKAYGRFAW